MKNKSSKCTIVIGMHRSGTSVIANALNTIGINLGANFIRTRTANPKGFFEDRRIVKLNDEMLRGLNCRWQSILIPDTSEDDRDIHSQQATSIIESLASNNHLFGFKDPRTTRLYSFWHDILDRSGIESFRIISNRDPRAVAKSLSARDGYRTNFALILCLSYQVECLRILLRFGGLVVSYHQLLEHPEYQIQRLSTFVGEPVNGQALDAFSNSFLDRALQRSDALSSKGDIWPEVDRLCMLIYELLSRFSVELTQPQTERYEADIVKAISQAEEFFSSNRAWIEEMDHLGMAEEHHLERRLKKCEVELARTRSKLSWLESRFPVRAYNRARNFLKKNDRDSQP